MRIHSLILSLAALAIAAVACSSTPELTATSQPTAASSPAPSATPTSAATATPTASPTPTPWPTPDRDATATPWPTSEPTPTGLPYSLDEPFYGVSLSPRSYEQEDFLAFFDLVDQVGGTLRWAGDWAELNDPNGGAMALANLQEQFGFTPVYEVNVFKQDPVELLRPLTDQNIQIYVDIAREFAEKEQPPFFGMGVEINILHEKMPEEFEQFVTLFHLAMEAVKEVSPNTVVFTTFQLEHMNGIDGGLWGEQVERNNLLLYEFEDADMMAFTTYPNFSYQDPSDIHFGDYSNLRDYWTGDIAFTEIGWPAESDIPGWESDDAEQAEFVETFFEFMETFVHPKMAIWSFMYDFPDSTLPEPFHSMALMRRDNTERPAFEAWRQAIASGE